MIKLLLITALCQTIGLAAGTLLSDPFLSPLTHSILALLVARQFKLPDAWQILNLILPLVFISQFESKLIPVIGLIVLLLIYLPTLWTKVPYYPTNNSVIDILVKKLPENKNFKFADFGSGFGGVLFDLSKMFPNGEFVGYELGIVPFIISKFRAFFFKNVKIKFQSFWKSDWKEFDYLYAFLSPDPMPAITKHFREITGNKPVFFVNSFPMGIKEAEEIKAGGQVIYVYDLS